MKFLQTLSTLDSLQPTGGSRFQKALEISPENFEFQKLGENFKIQKALENSPENFKIQKLRENFKIQKLGENFKIQKLRDSGDFS